MARGLVGRRWRQLVRGRAGTGKSYALDAAREAGGLEPRGCSMRVSHRRTRWSLCRRFRTVGRGTREDVQKSGPAASPQEELTCAPTPGQEEGPYYRDLRLERSDIREGRGGTPLLLEICVVDSDCLPVPEVGVDVWQCDALGRYSWYAAAGDDGRDGPAALEPGTFLRGSQTTSANGRCQFRTIYPGWYAGRTVHIHFKLHHAAGTLTGQLYFPDDLTDEIHERDPYNRRSRRDTTNADDVIYREGGSATLMQPAPSGDGHVAGVTLAINRPPRR